MFIILKNQAGFCQNNLKKLIMVYCVSHVHPILAPNGMFAVHTGAHITKVLSAKYILLSKKTEQRKNRTTHNMSS